MRTRRFHLCAASLLVLASACSTLLSPFESEEPPKPKPVEVFDPSPWLPPSADLLLKVDVAELADSSYGYWLSRWSQTVLQALSWRAGILADPRMPQVVSKSEVVYMAVEFQDGDVAPDITVVARVRERVFEHAEEALLGGGRATQPKPNLVLLSARSEPFSPGFSWPLPFNRESAVQFTADAAALRKQFSGDPSHWQALGRASHVRGELRTAYGLGISLAFEHAEHTSPEVMHALLDTWLARLRDDNLLRMMGMFEALKRTRAEAGAKSSSLVLTVEYPQSEVVCGNIDRGIGEMSKAAASGSVEDYLISHAKVGERLWDASSCRSLGWMHDVLSRQERLGDTWRWDHYRRDYVRESHNETRMRTRQARHLLDTKCSFRRQ